MAPDTSMPMVRSNENKIIYSNSMNTNRNELMRRLLSGVTDDELRNLVRVREEARRPIPAPRKMGVKQLIRYFENNPIPPYRPIPAPRTKKPQPVPTPRTKITKQRRALKAYTQSYKISIKNDKDALIQLRNTRLAISRLFETILNETKGFKLVKTIQINFEQMKNAESIDKTAYFNSRAQIILNSGDFLPSLQLSQQKLLNDIGA